MEPWRQGPIYEPQDSRYRPNSVATLIFFFIGKLFGLLFRGMVNVVVSGIRWLRRK